MTKKFLVILTLLAITTQSFAAYEEVECTTDPAFSKNSCNQCFQWGAKMEGDNLGLLTDLWSNVTDVSKILFKEEQKDPRMVNLSTTNVTWTQVPDAEKFWEYTDEFNALYSEKDLGYVLVAWKSVTWLKSTLSHAFNLEKNTAKMWENIGMLIYPIVTHSILASGEVSMDQSNEHLECVLFKSWEQAVVPVTPVKPLPPVELPKKLPQTGPAEYLLLLVLAMVSSYWVLRFKTKS